MLIDCSALTVFSSSATTSTTTNSLPDSAPEEEREGLAAGSAAFCAVAAEAEQALALVSIMLKSWAMLKSSLKMESEHWKEAGARVRPTAQSADKERCARARI